MEGVGEWIKKGESESGLAGSHKLWCNENEPERTAGRPTTLLENNLELEVARGSYNTRIGTWGDQNTG